MIWMKQTLSFISRFFVYNSPKDEEGGYELLEDEYEQLGKTGIPSWKYDAQGTQDTGGSGAQNMNAASTQGSGIPGAQGADNKAKNAQEAKNAPKTKKPFDVREWNNAKNAKNTQLQGQAPDLGRVSGNLQANIDAIWQIFSMPRNQDIVIRRFMAARKIK
jgi:spore germination protein KA